MLALAEAYEPGNYALCDGVDHVYRDVSNCCRTLRDDIRWALGSDVPFDGGYTPDAPAFGAAEDAQRKSEGGE